MAIRHRIWFISLVTIGALGLVLFSRVAALDDPASKVLPAQVEPVDGSSLKRITLSEKAAQRLAVATTPVADEASSGAARKVVPYGAVIYTPDGATWTYTNPEPLVFVRQPITVERIDGDTAILTEGPDAGTQVVIVGSAELLGVEFGVGSH